MATMLITEALQQVKIVTDRIQKERSVVEKYVTRVDRFKDPMEAQGGASKVIAQELQSISDLENNLVGIRIAIAKKNLEVTLTVEGVTRTVAEWLVWRREVANEQNVAYSRLMQVITMERTAHQKQVSLAPSNTIEGQAIKESNIIVNLDELKLAKDAEQLGLILGSLDAKLSILNATTTIEV